MRILRPKVAMNLLLGVATLATLGTVAAASFRPDGPEQPYCTCQGPNSCVGATCKENGCVPFEGLFGRCVVE